MILMARRTHRDKIVEIPSVMTVYIRPLNNAWPSARLPATNTLGWETFLSANPLVKATVAYVLTFPRVILLVRNLRRLTSRPFDRSFSSFSKSAFIASHSSHCSYKFGMMQI